MHFGIVMLYFYILYKMSTITQAYILINPVIEPAEKPKLLVIARGLYISSIVATICYIDSLAALYKVAG